MYAGVKRYKFASLNLNQSAKKSLETNLKNAEKGIATKCMPALRQRNGSTRNPGMNSATIRSFITGKYRLRPSEKNAKMT